MHCGLKQSIQFSSVRVWFWFSSTLIVWTWSVLFFIISHSINSNLIRLNLIDVPTCIDAELNIQAHITFSATSLVQIDFHIQRQMLFKIHYSRFICSRSKWNKERKEKKIVANGICGDIFLFEKLSHFPIPFFFVYFTHFHHQSD